MTAFRCIPSNIPGSLKRFEKTEKRSQKNFAVLQEFVEGLVVSGFKGISSKHKPHSLLGNYKNCYECHVQDNLLLIWQENSIEEVIILIRTGSHSDLF